MFSSLSPPPPRPLWLAPFPPLFGKFQHGAFASKLRAERKRLHCRLKFGRFTPFFGPIILLEENWTASLLSEQFAVDHFYFLNNLFVNMSTWYCSVSFLVYLCNDQFPTEQVIHLKVWARWSVSESTRKGLSQHLTCAFPFCVACA